MRRFAGQIAFVFATLLASFGAVYGQTGGTGISTLDPWTATTSPVSAITQRTFGRPIKITGLPTGNCLTLTASSILSTTACGSTSSGVSTTTNNTWTGTNAFATSTVGSLNGTLVVSGFPYSKNEAGIRSALSVACAMGGARVHIPAGNYSIASANGPLSVCSNVLVDGDGEATRVTMTGTSNVDMVVNANANVGNQNITIRDIWLQKNPIPTYPTGDPKEVIAFHGASSSTIDNVHFSYGGVDLEANTAFGGTGTDLTNGGNQFNKVINSHFDSTSLICVVNSEASHAIVANNTCYGYDSPISVLGAWNDVTITGNTIYGQSTAGQGIEANPDPTLEGWSNLSIVGNHLYNTPLIGIQISGQSNTLYVNGVVVSSNIIASSTSYGIEFDGNVKHAVVAGNVINASGRSGIALISDTSIIEDVNVSGNVIRNAGTTGTRPYGVFLWLTAATSTMSNILVSSNSIDSDASPVSTTDAVRLITENSGNAVTGLQVFGNQSPSSMAPFSASGLGTVNYATTSAIGPISGSVLNATSATASSTFANGINLTKGCFSVNGACLVSSTISSVSNGDGTLSVSPTTGAVVASLALSHPNTWTGAQNFGTSDTLFGAGVGSSTNPYLDLGSLGDPSNVWLDARAGSLANVGMVFRTKGGGSFQFNNGGASFAGSLSLNGGTTTAANGINLAGGCFSYNGTCLSQNAGTVTSVGASGGTTGLSFSGSPIASSGTLTLGGTLGAANGGTGSTTLSGLLKGNGTGSIQSAVAGTDYAATTSGSSLLYGNGSGGFSNASVSGPLSFSSGILSIGTVGIASGGTNATSQTSNGVAYFDGTKITSGSNLSWSGSRLTVAGQFYVNGSTFFMSQGQQIQNASDNTQWIGWPSSGVFGIAGVKVGIGTSSPAATLSTQGNEYATGGLGVGVLNTVGGTIFVQATASSSAYNVFQIASSTGTSVFAVRNTGILNLLATTPITQIIGDFWYDAVENGLAFYNGIVLRLTGKMYNSTASLNINSTTPTSVFSATASGTTTVPVGTAKPSNQFDIAGSGIYNTITGNTAALTITATYGTTTLATVTTPAFPASATNQYFGYSEHCTFQSTNTIICTALLTYFTTAGPQYTPIVMTAPAVFNPAVANTIDVKGSWSNTTGSPTGTIQQVKIDWTP